MPEENKRKTLYIFIDESGNFDFTPSGTKYFTLTAVSTLAPLKSREELFQRVYELKYAGWNTGQSDYYFHATEDRQEVRDWVFGAIKQLDDIEIDVIIAQKNKTNPSLYLQYEPFTGKPEKRDPFTDGPNKDGWREIKLKPIRSEELFYDKMSQMLLQYIFRRHEDKDHIEKIVVVLGSLFTDAKRGYVLKSLKRYLKNNFKKPFYVYFHATASDINCQIADYCGWAVYVKTERGETRPWEEIKGKVRSCFDVFARGDGTEYYEHKT
ncbi:MAG: hypothetical protein A3D65_02450 [Candidatus Lloydbacteria bacterium RIFCSPHIGHO2_02_FULL_50_13]|uniref:DUF3800 domain-containing protein n=1 Tax=Candidatus Lloydbacteria bacterium RIFCSPHIGHO2_02_FULL_50_13 TaxID=1798661 RepID=A0A1G2D9N3_9BACT|nr:MAG: hypothetical protein A3D65_02450 [Candidatus Lloydbacteria bacterium RIFCSPHIGHO2_02_FULL_50_13]